MLSRSLEKKIQYPTIDNEQVLKYQEEMKMAQKDRQHLMEAD